MKKQLEKSSKNKILKPAHPWRLCTPGRHWVREHTLHTPPSKKNPGGLTTIRHAHCADNPSKKDQLYPDEIQEISKLHFAKVKNKPCSFLAGFGDKGKLFDDYIAGWTQYWNDIFQPNPLLEPNFIKALIATESSFNPNILANKKNKNSARGLMQLTNESRKILGDEKGELKNHFLNITIEDLNDPSINICAGIRWLFRKRKIASKLLKRQATWEESIAEYKGCRTTNDKHAAELMQKYKSILNELSKCGK